MMRRLLMLSAIALGLGLALAACGESDEDKAKAEVCDARDDIRTQVRELQDLTLGTATADKVRKNLEAIGKDLEKIADTQKDLSDSDRQRVKKANQEFKSKLSALGDDIGKSVSIEDAAEQLKSDFAELATTYEQALAPLDCG
jgi:hypothetical protein